MHIGVALAECNGGCNVGLKSLPCPDPPKSDDPLPIRFGSDRANRPSKKSKDKLKNFFTPIPRDLKSILFRIPTEFFLTLYYDRMRLGSDSGKLEITIFGAKTWEISSGKCSGGKVRSGWVLMMLMG